MKRYILTPRRTLVGSALSMDNRRMGIESRRTQIAEVRSARRQDAVEKEVVRWLREGDPTHMKSVTNIDEEQLTGARIVEMTSEEAERLSRELDSVSVIEDCELDLIEPKRETAGHKNDLQDSDLWHLRDIGLTALRGNGFRGTGKDVGIAVLDTGIDDSHPDLAGRVVSRFAVSSQGPVIENPGGSDSDGHGTHVAGLVSGATTGVAPDAKIVDCLMLPGGRGRLSNFASALEWAAGQPEIEVLNMSAGLPGYREGLEVQILDLLATGVLPVIAIGNEGRDKTRSPGNYLQVLSVGASNEDRKVAVFSGSGSMVYDRHGYNVPTLVAPGESVYSCVMGGGYENWDGTSMATPVVSGVAALLLEAYPELTFLELGERLRESCVPITGQRARYGNGLIQVAI